MEKTVRSVNLKKGWFDPKTFQVLFLNSRNDKQQKKQDLSTIKSFQELCIVLNGFIILREPRSETHTRIFREVCPLCEIHV